MSFNETVIVARPSKSHRSRLTCRCFKASLNRRTPRFRICQILERYPIMNRLSRSQSIKNSFGRQIRFGQRYRTALRPAVPKRLGRGDFDEHSRGHTGACPDNCCIRRDVSALNTVGNLRSFAVGTHCGWKVRGRAGTNWKYNCGGQEFAASKFW